VDFRSDQFALGSILYEMATGRRAFQKKTAVETLTAILNDEPEPVASVAPATPAPVRWIVERCLAKEPGGRYASTEDLAREIATLRDHLTDAIAAPGSVQERRRFSVGRAAAAAVAVAALLLAGYLLGTIRRRPVSTPRFQKLSFQRGVVNRARFAPDGQSVVYAMAAVGSDLKLPELFATRIDSVDNHSLGLPPADIQAISPSGQLAISLLVPEHPEFGNGTLAQISLSGGTPREISVSPQDRWFARGPIGRWRFVGSFSGWKVGARDSRHRKSTIGSPSDRSRRREDARYERPPVLRLGGV
jgi:hypothetical protein